MRVKDWIRNKAKHPQTSTKSSLFASKHWFPLLRAAQSKLTNTQLIILSSIADNSLNTIVVCNSTLRRESRLTTRCPCGKQDTLLHWFKCPRYAALRRVKARKMLTSLKSNTPKTSLGEFEALLKELNRRLRSNDNDKFCYKLFTLSPSDFISKCCKTFDISTKRLYNILLPTIGELVESMFHKDKIWRPPAQSYIAKGL